MKIILLFCGILTFSASAFSQKIGDGKIIIEITDTSNVYLQIKSAFAKSNFSVREDMSRDTLTSFPVAHEILGNIVAKAVINDSAVYLYGFYSLKKMDYFGYTNVDKNYKRIIFMNSSKAWPILMEIANRIPGKKYFAK